MSLKRVYLIRHAEVELEFRSKYLGLKDVPLSKEGVKQSREFGEEFFKFLNVRDYQTGIQVWMSPLKRCQQTWQEMKIPVLIPPRIIIDLVEIDFGQWEGKTFTEVLNSHPDQVQKWADFSLSFSFPGGESLSFFQNRINRVKKEILECSNNKIILVTHGGVLSSLLCLMLGLDLSQYLIFELSRPSLACVSLYENGLGRLNELRSFSNRRGGDWPC